MKKSDFIVVLAVKPNKRPALEVLENTLEAMQEFVGGNIEEYMPFEDDVAIVCNEESKINGMPLNRAIYNDNNEIVDVIAGPFFICYAPVESENFLSLPNELVFKYADLFDVPEKFSKNLGGGLFVSKPALESEYLGVKYQFHEWPDGIDVEFMNSQYESIEWHHIDVNDISNADAIAKERAGDLAIGRIYDVLSILKNDKVAHLSQNARNLYEVFKSEFLDNGDMYDGCIPWNSSLVEGYSKHALAELLNAGLLQKRNCVGVAYELTPGVRIKLLSDKHKTVDELVSEASKRSTNNVKEFDVEKEM